MSAPTVNRRRRGWGTPRARDVHSGARGRGLAPGDATGQLLRQPPHRARAAPGHGSWWDASTGACAGSARRPLAVLPHAGAPQQPGARHRAVTGRDLYVATTYGLGLYDGKVWTQLAFGGAQPGGARQALGARGGAAGHRCVALVDGRGASFVAAGGQALALVERLPLPEGWSEHPSVADGAGRYLWVASEDRGLLRWDGARWQRFHDGRDLTDNWVTALSTDAEGRAVAGTCQDGFSYFDGSRWTRVRDARGCPRAPSSPRRWCRGSAHRHAAGRRALRRRERHRASPVPARGSARLCHPRGR